MTLLTQSLTLAKLRTGGRSTQTVVVRHVHVTDGGQAVVTGEMTAGGPRAVGGVAAVVLAPWHAVKRPLGRGVDRLGRHGEPLQHRFQPCQQLCFVHVP